MTDGGGNGAQCELRRVLVGLYSVAGIKTQGVDDEGFFNCCMKLNMPGIFDELQDVWES